MLISSDRLHVNIMNIQIEVLGLMAGSCEAMQAVARQKIDFFRLKKT